jgi:hypothetical protein
MRSIVTLAYPQRHGALQRCLNPRLPSPTILFPSPHPAMLFSGPIPLAPGEFYQGEQRDERRTGTHRCYVGGGELGLCLSSKKQQPPSPASCLILTARDLQRGGLSPGSSAAPTATTSSGTVASRHPQRWLFPRHNFPAFYIETSLIPMQF